ncbi:hypothetical protein VTI74DRAFT_4623 [Chaetomium olivicolor]
MPPDELPDTEGLMSSQLPPSARSVIDFFSRALLSFRSSSFKLQVICTAAPHDFNDGPRAPLPPCDRPQTLIVLDSSFNPPTRAHLRMATSAAHDLTQKEGQKLDALRLLLLLAVNNADKGAKPAAFDKRLAMMWAFARDVQQSIREESKSAAREADGEEHGVRAEDGLSIDLALTTAPFFHEKSTLLAEASFYNPENSAGQTEQLFLVGYDTLTRIFNPKYYPPLTSASQLAMAAESTPMQQALGPFFDRAKLRVTMRTDDEWGGEREQRAYLEDLLQAEGLTKVGGTKEWGSRIEMVEGQEVWADVVSSTFARAAAREGNGERLGRMVTPGVRWLIERQMLYAE